MSSRTRHFGSTSLLCLALMTGVVGIPFVADADSSYIPSYTSVNGSQGGWLLTREVVAARSAKALLMETVNSLPAAIGGSVTASGGFLNQNDTQAGACFSGVISGARVNGVVLVGIVNGRGRVNIAFDRTENSARSLPALLGGSSRQTQAAPDSANWPRQSIPDGSGWVRLPPNSGWHIGSGNNGMVSIAGPSGQAVELGIAMPIITPEAQQAFNYQRMQLGMPPVQTGVVLEYTGDPVRSIVEFIPIMSQIGQQMGNSGVRFVRIVSSTPAQAPQGVAAFVDMELEQIPSYGEPIPMRAFYYVNVAPTGNGQWLLYFSSITAPSATFAADFPTMYEIWMGWSVSDATLRARMKKAMQNMREIGDMIQSSHDYADRVHDAANADFSEYIRGRRTVEDTQTGERRDVDLGNASDIVRGLNEQAGGDRYREIPLRDQ